LKKIKSPLRYPGGKSKALKNIIPLVPEFDEYREPFIGGGSVFIELKQLFPNKFYWINDISNDVYLFWKHMQNDWIMTTTAVECLRDKYLESGHDLFDFLRNPRNYRTGFFDDITLAARFFILNRITFSGTIDSGGYSQQAFEKRFTSSSIERLTALRKVLDYVKISNFDYSQVVAKDGENVFIYLDPPYFSNKKSNLYGKNGDLHNTFDHQKFSKFMKDINHKWLITYDDCEEIRDLFGFAEIIPWELQYGMNNVAGHAPQKGKEIFIKNY
jgi:DNA adenine methylase